MLKLRVLRIMEYEFDSYEQMEFHFSHAYVPLNGTKISGNNVVRSTAIVNIFEQEREDEVSSSK